MTAPLDPKKDPERRCLKVGQWPEADRLLWQKVLKPGTLLDDAGLGAHWAFQTRDKIEKHYGGWLNWLERNQLLDPAVEPALRVTRERVVAYVDDLKKRNAPLTVLNRIRELCNAIQAMAPDRDWSWLHKIIRRLRRSAKPKRKKETLMVPAEHLFRSGIELMDAADSIDCRKPPLSRAAQYRDGLVIALLAARPVRRRNLASIEIGRHLIRQGEKYWLIFPPDETKTHRAYAAPLPAALNPHLERYLDHYRPFLIGLKGRWGAARPFLRPGDRLWVSNYASAMSGHSIYHRVVKLTAAKFGHSLCLHLFRDVAATSIAVETPEHVQIIPGHLGHATSATSEKHYIHARSLEPTRKYPKHLLGLRAEKPRVNGGADQ
jgi:integrase/recombinase XerD